MKGEILNNLFILKTIVEIFLINFFLFLANLFLHNREFVAEYSFFKKNFAKWSKFSCKKFNGAGTKRDYICHF
jgi:hypothetical protein